MFLLQSITTNTMFNHRHTFELQTTEKEYFVFIYKDLRNTNFSNFCIN